MTQFRTDPSVPQEIIDQVARLDQDEQRQVLDYAKALAGSKKPGECGTRLLEFVGGIPPEDLREMERAIQEGCEKVDPNGW